MKLHIKWSRPCPWSVLMTIPSMLTNVTCSHLESCGTIEFGGVNRLWKNISDIGDEFLQVFTGLLQVCCVDDNLNKLENKSTCNANSPETSAGCSTDHLTGRVLQENMSTSWSIFNFPI